MFEFGLNAGLELPMVVYCDNVAADGGFAVNQGETFAFVPSVLFSTMRRFSACGARCTWLASQINVALVHDPDRGRLKDWPPFS